MASRLPRPLTGRYDDVIRAMKQSVARYPERGQLHVLLAMAYARIGHREEARRETAEVQRLMPFFDGDTFVTLLRDPAHRLAVTEGLRSAELTK